MSIFLKPQETESNMKWEDLKDQECSVARTLAVIGDRWTLMILSDCFLGAKRFEEFRERLGLSKSVLNNRLKSLEDNGILERIPYQQNPVRVEYKLTKKGRDLSPIIFTIVNWGDKYYAGEAGPPILYRHTQCGHDFEPVLSCSDCGEKIRSCEIDMRTRPSKGHQPPSIRGPISRA